jgi:ketosteroid isomerase-like protein
MKNLLFACAVLLVFNACQQPAPADSAAETALKAAQTEDAVRQADLDWSKAAESANWSDDTGYFSFLLDDAVFLPPNEPGWKGKASIKEKLNPYFSMPGFSAKWEPAQVNVSVGLGYTMGNYDMLMKDSTGATSVLENGKYLVIWKQQTDGKWKVAAESFNSNAPAEAQENQ